MIKSTLAALFFVLAPGCALAHEVSVDANVDAGGDPRVLAACSPGEAGSARDCGWMSAGTFTCRPGTLVDIGCSSACGLGSCSGDSMIRVCDRAPCNQSQALGFDDDECGSLCSMVRGVPCPASGQLFVLTAPFTAGQPYACSLATR